MRTAALSGVVALACAMGIAGTAHADPDVPTTVVSSDFLLEGTNQVESGIPRNYAVNLGENASPRDFTRIVSRATKLGGVVLEQYPEFNSFFVQSADGGFAGKLNKEAAGAGIALHSIGPTRMAVVKGAEIVVPDANQSAIAEESKRESSFAVDSQLDDVAFSPDPDSSKAWGLEAIGADKAQSVDVKLSEVTVAVLDSGIDGDHPDLASQIRRDLSVGCQKNGVPDTSQSAWDDEHYHGTHVAGTIAAAHNGIGIDGVAPNAKLAAVKVSNADGLIYPEYVTCGFVWAADKGIPITNNSYYVDPWLYWVADDPTQAAGMEVVSRAASYSHSKGVTHIAAAGNKGLDLDNPTTDSSSPNDRDKNMIIDRDVSKGTQIPTQLDPVIRVSAVGQAKTDKPMSAYEVPLVRAGFSNYGYKSIDVTAPGVSIYSTIPMDLKTRPGVGYARLNGTSMAAPHVSGVAALIKAVHPEYGPQEVRQQLGDQAATHYSRLRESYSADGEQDYEYRGFGLVNAYAAVTEDLED
ncbi:MAG: S8 family serine peptidase [Actinomycetaceae bacterium]|nr:S8 family serine peptidase [Actinomycetaceae bacterium]